MDHVRLWRAWGRGLYRRRERVRATNSGTPKRWSMAVLPAVETVQVAHFSGLRHGGEEAGFLTLRTVMLRRSSSWLGPCRSVVMPTHFDAM